MATDSEPPKPDAKPEAHRRKHRRLSRPSELLICIAVPALCTLVYLWILNRYQIPAPPEQLSTAHDYCPTLAQKASAISNVHAAIALLLTLGSLAAGYVAVSVVNHAETDAPFFTRHRNTLLALCTILFVPLGLISYKRSDAAVELAASANEARLEGKKQNAICLAAWSAWVRSRLDSNAIGKAALIEKSRQREDETTQAVLQSASTTEKTVAATKQTLEAVKAIAAAAPAPKPSASAEAAARQQLQKTIEDASRQLTEAQQAVDVAKQTATKSGNDASNP